MCGCDQRCDGVGVTRRVGLDSYRLSSQGTFGGSFTQHMRWVGYVTGWSAGFGGGAGWTADLRKSHAEDLNELVLRCCILVYEI